MKTSRPYAKITAMNFLKTHPPKYINWKLKHHIPVQGQEEQRDNTLKRKNKSLLNLKNEAIHLKFNCSQVPHSASRINKLLKTHPSISRDNFKQNSQESIYTGNIATETHQQIGQLCFKLLLDREHWLEMGG